MKVFCFLIFVQYSTNSICQSESRVFKLLTFPGQHKIFLILTGDEKNIMNNIIKRVFLRD